MESLVKSKKQTETSTHSQHQKVEFIEVVKQPGNSDKESNSVNGENLVNDYENFWATDEFDDTLQSEQQTFRPQSNQSEFKELTEHLGDIMTDPVSNASKILANGYEEFLEERDIDYLKIEDKDTDVEYFSEFGSFDLIDQSEKSQPLTILKEEFTINEITTPNNVKNYPKVTKEVNSFLSEPYIAGGSVFILCSLSVICLCVYWTHNRRKLGKLSLVGGCSRSSPWDTCSIGSVASLRSLYSMDLSDSFDTISGDHFRSSLEDEM